MGRDKRQEALAYLLEQAEKQGYVTFDNIMDCADANSLPIQDFDWLTSAITTRGIIVYDEAPSNRTVTQQEEDDYDDYAQIDYDDIYDQIIELAPSLESFIAAVRNIIPPQWKEFDTLKYQVLEGNQHARERMIEMHLRVALRIALQRAKAYDMDIEDAVGEACIGLVMAVDKYNPDTNGAFGSYAAMWVLQNLSRQQPTRRPLVYYPVHKKDVYFSAYPLLKECGFIDNPKSVEKHEVRRLLIKRLSLTNEQTDDVLVAATEMESLDEMYFMFFKNIDDFEKHEEDEDLDDIVPDELLEGSDIDEQIIDDSLKKDLKDALLILKDRQREVIELRYGLKDGQEKTLEEVGQYFGVTRERVRQIEKKSLRTLRKSHRSKGLLEYMDLSPSEIIEAQKDES